MLTTPDRRPEVGRNRHGHRREPGPRRRPRRSRCSTAPRRPSRSCRRRPTKVGPGLPLEVAGARHRRDRRQPRHPRQQRHDPTAPARPSSPAACCRTTVTFRMSVPQNANAGPDDQALRARRATCPATSRSAASITLTVDPAITIATPPGLMGRLLADGTTSSSPTPRAIASSTKDSKLYVADQAQTGACRPSCIWRVESGDRRDRAHADRRRRRADSRASPSTRPATTSTTPTARSGSAG